MILNEDFEKIKERYEAFWEGEIVDRALISIFSLSANPRSDRKELQYKNLEQKWLDKDFILNNSLYGFENTYFEADAYPSIFTNLGPGCMAACIGSDYNLADNTIWFDSKQVITDWSNPPALKDFKKSEMWGIIKNLTGHFIENSNGDFITSLTDIGGTMDIIASLRGTQELLMDLYDYEDEILKYINEVDKVWKEIFFENAKLLEGKQDGFTNWIPIWSKKPWFPLQCDFSTMISPNMFEKFVAPSLQFQASIMERSIYHLDGEEELPHLDQILSIKEISGIQWVSKDCHIVGSGDEKWMPLFQKIQKSGKSLVLMNVPTKHLKKLFDNLSPKGIYINTWSANEEEAREVLEMVKKWK